MWIAMIDRETAELLLWKLNISGKVLSGGTKTVEQDQLLDWLLLRSMDRIPVDERVMEAESGTRIGR